MRTIFASLAFFAASSLSLAGDGNRLSYLDSNEVWFPHKDFPKLITPQWVGEEGVECVVTLAIDDMRDTAKYEAFLRPILQRLKQIDGRAPVSIMTNSVKPDDPQLQAWLQEGLSLECHTADHPCPILAGGDIKKAKATYDKCVDLMASIPNNKPVAFRTPCCDSLNTVSPRLFSEIINQTTPNGNFLQLDSSVFTLYTADDPSIPRELVTDPDGREKFRKYIPRKLARGNLIHDGFVNTIENYPYPYVIQRMCWEFPCMVPSDWSANHLQQPNNPDTVRDLKAALDITVLKQGVFNLVFHPHGWIKSEQVIELIDHAVAKHGKKVKFLTFKECVERLNANLLKASSLRGDLGRDEGARLVDINGDGFMDVMQANAASKWSRVWNVPDHRWSEVDLAGGHDHKQKTGGEQGSRGLFSIPPTGAAVRYEVFGDEGTETWDWRSSSWSHTFVVPSIMKAVKDAPFSGSPVNHDLNGDGWADRLIGVVPFNGINRVYASLWLKREGALQNIPVVMSLPAIDSLNATTAVSWSEFARTKGVRLVDVNEDGVVDMVVSNSKEFGVWLKPWTTSRTELIYVKRGEKPAALELPPIVREDGSDNGFFVRDRHLCWINEDTDGLPDFVLRVAFDTLLGDRLPDAKSPDAAKQSMRVTPGYRVDLVAHEPLTMDPVALDFGPDGKLWVAEMADYPNGIPDDQVSGGREPPGSSDGNEKATRGLTPPARQFRPGGRIRYLEDTDGDGVYDKSTLFLDGVPFPNGVIAWKKGVLVSAAPDIFYAEDTDGDGKADVKHVLFTGFAEGNQQHRANGFSRGLDNWLYLANGDSGGTVMCVQSLNDVLKVSDSPRPGSAGRGVGGEGQNAKKVPTDGKTEKPLTLALSPQGRGEGTKPKAEEKRIDIRGRDIRIRPDTGEIEAVSGQTQFGRNRDDWGNWFGNNNSRPMYHYVLDDHYLRRNPNLVPPNLQKDVSITPGASPVFPSSKTLTRFNDFHTANRFTSACSAIVDRGGVLGAVGSRQSAVAEEGKSNPDSLLPTADCPASVFISEPVHNLVHREIMTADGFSFTSRRDVNEAQSEFLSSTDNWFRPTQLKIGPDGALYVADMYRLVIEHPQWIPIEWQKKLDLRAGHDKGRIWRVAPVGMERRKNPPSPRRGFSDPEPPLKPRPIPLHGGMPILSVLDTDELVAALDSPNGWQRDVAQQLLIDQFSSLAIPLLRDQEKTSKNPLCRLHSLCTLDGFLTSEKAPRDNSANLLSSPAWAREQCYRRAMDALIEILPSALADPHRGIRRHAIRICEWFGAPNSRPLVGSVMVTKFHESILDILSKLVDDPDPQVRLQLAYTLGEIKHPQAGTLLGRLALKSEGNPYFTAAILSSLHSENLEATLAEVMKHGSDQQGSDQTGLLQQLLGQATAFNREASLVALLNRATEPKSGGGFERWQYSAIEQFLVTLDRRFTTLDKWLNGLSAEARPVAGRLQTLFASARTLAASDAAAPQDRIAAVRVLGRSADAKDEIGLLGELITPRHPPELQSAALATLARSKSGEIAKTLLANYRSFAPSLRSQSSDILLSRDAWRDELLAALEAKQLSPSDLDAATRQRLLDHKTKAVAARAAKILAVDLNSDRAKVVAEFLPTVRAGGDEQLGSQLFKKMCSQCHKLGDVGHAVGPDLMSLTDKSPDAMITAVLDPNRAVEAKFLTFTAITKAGVSHTGLMAAETATSLTLRAAEGKEITLLRSEIDELQSNAKSLMPEGLEKDLKPVDAAALVAYIRRNVPLPAMKKFPGNAPRVVAPAADGKFTLTPFEAEIYGPTIVIEEKHKNLGWWSSADDIVVWTINVPKAGTYSVSWTCACEPSAAGNRVVVEAAGKSLTHRVEKTTGWDDYQSQDLGNLELPAGEVRLTMKPASRPLPALGDVKSVLLVPTP